MEHLAFVIIDLVLSIDRSFQKPIDRSIPDIDALLDDPTAYLSKGEMVFRPVKRYGTVFSLAVLICGMLLLAAIPALVDMAQNVQPGKAPRSGIAIIVVSAAIGVPLLCCWALFRLFRGGQAILTQDGITFVYSRTSVSCPWVLFGARGHPIRLDRSRVLIPIRAEAIPLVEITKDGAVVEQGGTLKTKQIEFRFPASIVMRDLYEVRLQEFAQLLLDIGSSHAVPADRSAMLDSHSGPSSLPSLFSLRDDGVVRVPSTHLSFPPLCCSCCAPTRGLHTFRFDRTWGIIDGTSHVKLTAPLCDSCSPRDSGTYWKTFASWIGIGLAAVPAIGLGLWVFAILNPELDDRTAGLVVGLACVAAIVCPFLSIVAGHRYGKAKSSVIRVQSYSPGSGMLLLRFRNQEYARLVLDYLESNS